MSENREQYKRKVHTNCFQFVKAICVFLKSTPTVSYQFTMWFFVHLYCKNYCGTYEFVQHFHLFCIVSVTNVSIPSQMYFFCHKCIFFITNVFLLSQMYFLAAVTCSGSRLVNLLIVPGKVKVKFCLGKVSFPCWKSPGELWCDIFFHLVNLSSPLFRVLGRWSSGRLDTFNWSLARRSLDRDSVTVSRNMVGRIDTYVG